MLPAGVRKTFLYGPDARMRQVQGPSTAVLADYCYNGRGERVRKSVDLTEAYTLYDEAGRWLGDYNANGTPVQQVVWLDDLPVGVVPGIVLGGGGEYEDPDPGHEPPCFPNCGAERGTGSMQSLGSGSGTAVYYIEPDHLGTPRVVIEPTRNVAVWSWDLKGEAFGDTAPNQNPDGDGADFVLDMRFPGQRYGDPIGLQGGISTYSYVSGAPTNSIDPLGLIGYVCQRGNSIGISIPIFFEKDSDQAVVDRIISTMEKGWTGKYGNYQVVTKVMQVKGGWNSAVNLVQIINKKGQSVVNNNNHGVLYSTPLYPNNWDYVHEAGHFLGLGNLYNDPLWKGVPNVMNDSESMRRNVRPNQGNIENVLQNPANKRGCLCE